MVLAFCGAMAWATDTGISDPVAGDLCSILTVEQVETVVGRPVLEAKQYRLGEAGTAVGRCVWKIAAPEFPPMEGEVVVEAYGDGQQAFDEQLELFSTWYTLTEELGEVSAAYGPGYSVSFVHEDYLFMVQVLVYGIDSEPAALEIARLLLQRPYP